MEWSLDSAYAERRFGLRGENPGNLGAGSHKHGGLVQMIFQIHLVILRFHVHFQGCRDLSREGMERFSKVFF